MVEVFSNADVGAATALQTGQGVLDLGLTRLLLVSQQGGGGHQPAVDAIAALRHLFLDVSCLQGMRFFRSAQTGERNDLGLAHGGQRCNTRARRLTVEMHRTSATLGQPAAEMWIVEPDVIAQGVEQRHVGIRVYRVVISVYIECEFLHHGWYTLPRRMVAAQFGDWPALITRQRLRRKPGLILLSHSAESTDVEMPHPRLQAGSSTSATPKRSGGKAAVQSSHQLSAQVYAIHNFYPTFADEIVSRGAARKG
jgi:hypothetical protein